MPFSGMLRYVALVRTDFSEELSAFIIRVTRIGELETTLPITSNRCTLLYSSPILDALIMEALSSTEMSNLQEPRSVRSQKTPFLIQHTLHEHVASLRLRPSLTQLHSIRSGQVCIL
jgi:hypothetical protein